MTSISWPNSLGVDTAFSNRFERISENVYHGDGTYPGEIGLDVFDSGKGRVVYDITEHSEHQAVLKVAHNSIGARENRHEIYDRQNWSRKLRGRLVPAIDHGKAGLWVIQPKVNSISFREQKTARDELRSLVEQAGGDPREVHCRNIGEYNGFYVLFDFGGL
jgi:hypothetical protein